METARHVITRMIYDSSLSWITAYDAVSTIHQSLPSVAQHAGPLRSNELVIRPVGCRRGRGVLHVSWFPGSLVLQFPGLHIVHL